MRKISSNLKLFLSKHDRLDIFIKTILMFIAQTVFFAKFFFKKTVKNKYIFECFQGKNVCDSPLAIYNKLLENEKNSEFIWVLNSRNHEAFKSYLISQIRKLLYVIRKIMTMNMLHRHFG